MKLKALLLGDNLQAKYHPLKGVEKALESILNAAFDLVISDDYGILAGELEQFSLVICYSDRWKDKLPDDEIGGLVSYVAKGGGLLVLHNGISLSNRNEFKAMAGGWFTHHPDSVPLSFVLDSKHPLCTGIGSFVMHEEPYRYGFCDLTGQEVFLHYLSDGELWPAGWSVKFCKGKVVCLHPGHDVKSFLDPCYCKIVLRSALWCAGR